VAAMKAMPTDDPLFGKGTIRADGRKIHPMYLMQVKAPAESKGEWDAFKVVGTIEAEKAFRPLPDGGCPLVARGICRDARLQTARSRLECHPPDGRLTPAWRVARLRGRRPMNELRIRTMRPEEVSIAVEWAAAEGWNPGLVDAACFAAADPDGFLIRELDGAPAATVSCVNYRADLAF